MAQNSGLGVFLDDKAHERFLEILFQGRNKSYGAFFLRRTYSSRVLAGILVTIGTVVFLVLLPYIIEALRPKPKFDPDTRYVPVMIEDFPEPPGYLAYQPEIKAPEEAAPVVTADSVPPKEIEPEQPIKKDPTLNARDTSAKSNPPLGGGGDPKGHGPYGPGVNTLPVPPGGKGINLTEDWTAYVRAHLRYPPEARRKGIKGKVVVTVNISKEGEIKDARIKQSVSPELDKAALDMINAMPEWKPAIRNGWAKVQPLDLSVDFGLARE